MINHETVVIFPSYFSYSLTTYLQKVLIHVQFVCWKTRVLSLNTFKMAEQISNEIKMEIFSHSVDNWSLLRYVCNRWTFPIFNSNSKIFRDNIRNIATDIKKVRIKNNKIVLFHDVLLKSSVRVHWKANNSKSLIFVIR